MSLNRVFDDGAYRALTEQVIHSAADEAHIDVTSIEFAQEDREQDHAWLCFIVDPSADDHVAGLTGSSAADHFALMDPNGFLRNAGSQIRVTVFDMEVSNEASIVIRDEHGEQTLFSPWIRNLAVAKAVFSYSIV
jgi:hypothetical protein